METFSQLIGTVGFPIACVIAMGWFIHNVYNLMVEKWGSREEKLYEVITTAQENNEKLAESNREFVRVLETYRTDITEIKHDIEDIKDIIVKER